MGGTPARRLLPLLSGLAALLLASGPAGAGDSFQLGAWHGRAYTRGGNIFNHCTMSASYQDGHALYFRITRTGGLQMGIYERSWSMTRGSTFPVSFTIDDGQAHRGTAIVTTRTGVWIILPDTRTMLERLRWGRVLRIYTTGTTFSYKLAGTAVALRRLLHCVESEIAVETGRPRPAFVARPNTATKTAAGTGAGRGGRSARTELRLKATTMMANLFNKAGLKDFELVDPDEKPSSMKDYDVVWKGPGVIGGMRIVGQGTRTDVQKVGASLIAQEALVCKGQFRSGIKSDRSAKAIGAVRLFTACDAPTGWNALYSILPLPKRGFVMIAQYAQGGLARLQDVDERMFGALPDVIEK